MMEDTEIHLERESSDVLLDMSDESGQVESWTPLTEQWNSRPHTKSSGLRRLGRGKSKPIFPPSKLYAPDNVLVAKFSTSRARKTPYPVKMRSSFGDAIQSYGLPLKLSRRSIMPSLPISPPKLRPHQPALRLHDSPQILSHIRLFPSYPNPPKPIFPMSSGLTNRMKRKLRIQQSRSVSFLMKKEAVHNADSDLGILIGKGIWRSPDRCR